MSTPPQISGYRLEEQLLDHPLAVIWRGRSIIGMDVVVLELTAAGAADPAVRARLERASRAAALEPGQAEAPLWAGNFTTTKPYAVTQLLPGRAGVERLLDPLDGILGNDQAGVDQVRQRLLTGNPPAGAGQPAQPYGAGSPGLYAGSHAGQPGPYAGPAGVPSYRPESTPGFGRTDGSPGLTGVPARGPEPAPAFGQPGGAAGPGGVVRPGATGFGGRTAAAGLGRRIYIGIAVIVLTVFSLAYSVGTEIRGAVDGPQTLQPKDPAPAAVSPSPLPTGAMLPGIRKVTGATFDARAEPVAVVGPAYAAADRTWPVEDFGLPFVFRWPAEPGLIGVGESSYAILRRVVTGEPPNTTLLRAAIVAHPCRDLARCQAERVEFGKRWTKRFRVPAVPTTARDSQTWFSEVKKPGKPYSVVMTRVFAADGRWWLIGVEVRADPAEAALAQKILNDIRTQTR